MDNQGTVRDLIDNDGTVINHISYDSFGQITEQTNSTAFFRFGYTGREFDTESGQYFYRARYYDPGVGRFISEDPIGFRAGDSNLYRYVGNSSPNYIDPTGNFSVGQFANDVLASDLTYDLVNRYDQFFAGFGDVASFGATTKIREAAYGKTATRNHQGGLFHAGQGAGFVTSFAVGTGAPSALKGVTLAQRFAQGHTVVGAGVGAYQSTRNILGGCATWWDALSFAPVAGYGANKAAPHLRNLAQSVDLSQLSTATRRSSGSFGLRSHLSKQGIFGSETGAITVGKNNSNLSVPPQPSKVPISMEEALELSESFLVPGVPQNITQSQSGIQIIQNFVDSLGRKITRRVGLDVNPTSKHVLRSKQGPHLNMQTQIDGVIQPKNSRLADPHIPIDPNTVRSGDF